jgi:hypothetical protein
MATIGQKEIRNEYPHEQGLTAETTTQEFLTDLAYESSISPQSSSVGL